MTPAGDRTSPAHPVRTSPGCPEPAAAAPAASPGMLRAFTCGAGTAPRPPPAPAPPRGGAAAAAGPGGGRGPGLRGAAASLRFPALPSARCR